jgi:quinolinate synthase
MLPATNLPKSISDLSDNEAHKLVRDCKQKLSKELVILGHHYQRDEVIEHADYTGDSLKLARIAEQNKHMKYIMFCGVHFMAETADILTAGQCEVCLPDLGAGCEMADMADIKDVKLAWQDAVASGLEGIVPVTYINSSAALKAFVGDHGGVICTSSNARAVSTWALNQGKHLFFFPDQHLGRNITKAMGYDIDKDMLLWNPKKHLGGNSLERLQTSKVWLWEGHCPVHALFTVHQIKRIRESSPETKILVHPECSMEIVDLSDLNGSTDFIIKTIEAAPSGSSWAVGTEKNLVERLAKTNSDKKIVSLNPYSCLCGTMNRISIHHLAWALNEICEGRPMPNRIQVSPELAAGSLRALGRMMELS